MRPSTATRRGCDVGDQPLQLRGARSQLLAAELGGVAGRARGDVGDADAVGRQVDVLLGREQPRREARGVQRGVEAVAGACEVVADLGGAQPRVDADEQDVQAWTDDRREQPRHVECPLCAWSDSRSTSRTPCSTSCGDRLERTRWPGAAPGEAWAQGTDYAYLRELTAYWRRGFDWREQERELNRWPQFAAEIGGVRIHFVHVRGGGIPLILTHGWPSAFIEYLPLIERLRSSFDLVVPSLPGYGFSERPPRLTTRDTAWIWHQLMQGLGYERYGAQGGDFGAAVTTYMALDDPERMLGIHLSNLDNAPARRDTTDRGRARVRRRHRALGRDRARLQLHPGHQAADARLRPDRLAHGAGRLDPREVAQLGR